MTEEQVKAIRARAAAASSGPWTTVGNTLYFPGPYPGGRAEQNVDWFAFPGNIPTAEFIAHAREDIPALLDEVDRLSRQVQELAGALERADEALRWVLNGYE